MTGYLTTTCQMKDNLYEAVSNQDVIAWRSVETCLHQGAVNYTSHEMEGLLNTTASQLLALVGVVLSQLTERAEVPEEWVEAVVVRQGAHEQMLELQKTYLFLVVLCEQFPDQVWTGLENIPSEKKRLLKEILGGTRMLNDLSSLFTLMGRTRDIYLGTFEQECKEPKEQNGLTW